MHIYRPPNPIGLSSHCCNRLGSTDWSPRQSYYVVPQPALRGAEDFSQMCCGINLILQGGGPEDGQKELQRSTQIACTIILTNPTRTATWSEQRWTKNEPNTSCNFQVAWSFALRPVAPPLTGAGGNLRNEMNWKGKINMELRNQQWLWKWCDWKQTTGTDMKPSNMWHQSGKMSTISKPKNATGTSQPNRFSASLHSTLMILDTHGTSWHSWSFLF